jgi:hypothetical protein
LVLKYPSNVVLLNASSLRSGNVSRDFEAIDTSIVRLQRCKGTADSLRSKIDTTSSLESCG